MTKTTKTALAKFFIARARKIAIARAKNVKQGTSVRAQRAAAKLAAIKATAKKAKKATKTAVAA